MISCRCNSITVLLYIHIWKNESCDLSADTEEKRVTHSCKKGFMATRQTDFELDIALIVLLYDCSPPHWTRHSGPQWKAQVLAENVSLHLRTQGLLGWYTMIPNHLKDVHHRIFTEKCSKLTIGFACSYLQEKLLLISNVSLWTIRKCLT